MTGCDCLGTSRCLRQTLWMWRRPRTGRGAEGGGGGRGGARATLSSSGGSPTEPRRERSPSGSVRPQSRMTSSSPWTGQCSHGTLNMSSVDPIIPPQDQPPQWPGRGNLRLGQGRSEGRGGDAQERPGLQIHRVLL